jgi:tape measure domain-containing protein
LIQVGAGADFDVALEVKPQGAVRGARELAGATKELTTETRRSGEESRKAKTATEELAEAERRRMAAAAEMIRSVKAQISALADYQRQLLQTASAEAARAAAAARNQTATVANTGVDPSSKLGAAMTALLERERQLRASIKETAEELARNDKVAGNISALQARTKAMEGALSAAQRGEEAERAYAEAMEVRRQIEASGARPGTDQAAAVEKEVRAQQRLEAELRAVAAARERDRRAAVEADAQRDRVAGEIARLRETTHQLEVLANAHRRGGAAVREANVQLEVRNALLRAGVAAGSAEAQAIEQQIRRQAQLRQEIDQATAAKRRATDGAGALRNAFFALQGAIAALGLAALVRDAVNVALALDRAQKALVAATGSTAGAAREMSFVRGEADRLGLVLTDTAQAYAGLAAAARGTSLEGAGARDIFSAVAEAASVMGLSADQSAGALQAIQQMISKGNVQAEELRGQLGERLPGAFQLAARAMGTTTAGLSKMLEQGKVTAADMLPKLAAELRKTFGPGLVNAVNSAQANLNRFRNALDEIKGALGEGFLAGFLAGFSDLRESMTSEELRAAARDLGENIGKALRTAADAAAFLAKNLELVKAVLIAIIALRAAAMYTTLAAAMKEAGGAAIFLRNALASLPLAAVAIALGYLVSSLDDYIQAQNLAHEQEMKRVQHSREIFDYYNTLKAKTEGLTEAERAYALEVRKTLQTQLTAARIELQRKRDFYSQSGRAGFYGGPDAEAKIRANVEQKEEVIAARQEVENLTNELRILNDEWLRLSQLPAPELEVEDKGLDKTASKIRDLLEGFKRTAEQAERVARAQRVSAAEARRVTDAIERENAAYQALHSIEGLSADAKAKLTAIIEGYVGRTQDANRATAELIATRERDLDYTNQAREAEAQLADARAGSTQASRDLAAALEAEAFAREIGREEDIAFIAQLTAAIQVRHEYIRSIEAEVAALQRSQEWTQELAGLQAKLADAQAEGTAATREHTIWLEAERLRIAEGVAAWEPRAEQLRQEVRERALIRGAIEAQIAAQNQLNAAQAKERQAKADFADWQEEIAAVRRYGSEIAGILSQYGLLNKASRELAIQEEILQAAREQGLDVIRTQTGAITARNDADFLKLLAIEGEIRGQHEVLDNLNKIKAQHALLAYAVAPLEEAWRQVGTMIKDQLVELVVTGKASWEELANSMLRMMVDAVIQWMIRSIAAHRAVQAEAVKTAAINAAASNAGGGTAGVATGAATGGGGMFSGLWSGAGATGWLGKAGGMKGLFGGTGGYGAAGASLAWAAVFVAVVAALLNQAKTEGRAEVDTSIKFGGGQGMAVDEETSRYNRQGGLKRYRAQLKAMEEMIKAVTSFIQGIGGEIDKTIQATSSMTVGREGQGKKTNWFVRYADGLVKHFGKDQQAAMEFAMVQAIKQAPTVGLSPEVAAAIKASTAEKMDALQRDIDTAMKVVRARLGSTGSQVYDTYKGYEQEIRAAAALGLATDALVAARDKELRGIRDSILGIDTSTAEYLESLASFNRGIDEASLAMRQSLENQIAQARAQMEELIASGPRTIEGRNGAPRTQSQEAWEREIARLREQVDRYLGELDKIPEKLSQAEIDMGIFDALYKYLEGNSKYAAQAHKYAQLKVELEFAAIQAQLVALGRWEEFAEMFNDAYAAARAAAGRPNRGGGGGSDRKNDQESLRDLLDESAWAEKMRGLSDYMQGVAELNRKWDEAAKLAHGNKKLLAEVAAARERELAALREQARQEHREELKPWLEDFGKSDWDLKLQDLRKQFEEGRKKAKELGEAIWKVNLAETRAAHALGRQAVAALNLPTDQTIAQFKALSDTLNFVRNNAQALGITQEEVARITSELGNQLYISLVDSLLKFVDNEQARKDIEELRYQMEIANIKLQFELVKEMGVLTEEQTARVQALINALPENAPPAGGSGGGGGGGGTVNNYYNTNNYYEQQQQQAEEAARQREQAEARLRQYEELGLAPIQVEINRVNEEFAELRAALGNTTRVQTAYALAIQDIISRALQPIRDLQASLNLSEFSPLKRMERLSQAQAQFQSALTALQGGDLTQLESIANFAQTYLQEALSALPQGSAAYNEIFAQVNSALAAILAEYGQLPAGTPGGSGGTPPAGGSGSPPPPPVNLGPLAGQIQASSDAELVELREIKRNTADTKTEVYFLRRRLDQPISVFEIVS